MRSSRIRELHQETDGNLISLYINESNTLALEVLHERYKDQIYNFILKMVKDRDTANDLYQETYLTIIEKINNLYDHRGKFNSWAMTIAYNNCIDYFRYNKKFADSTLLGDEFEVDYFDMIPSDENPERDLIEKERKKLLDEGIETLADNQQRVIEHRNNDMLYKDMVDIEGDSINTLLGRYRYAKINLKKYVEENT